MSRFATPVLTVTGDRQTGKTETLLRQALFDANEGRRVLYVTDDFRDMRNTFLRAEEMVGAGSNVKVVRSNGNEEIWWPPPRGVITFKTPLRSVRGATFDTVLLDEVRESYDQYLPLLVRHSKSPRIVRAVFKSAGA